jgi:hypothetical protein
MPRDRLPFRLVLLLGVVAVTVFHAPGAIDRADADGAAAVADGTLDGRLLGLGVDLVRVVFAPTSTFRALHVAAGILLALAAALSAAVAFRAADALPGAGLAAALFVGPAVLFGADTGGLGGAAGPAAVVLVLLAGSAAAWTLEAPRALLGGLLLGAAVGAHPAALLVLPGFAALAAAAARRAPGGPGRSALGFALGLALLHLPPSGGSFGDALGAWWAGGPWRPAGPASWGGGAAELARVLWRNAGPLGIAAAVGGLVAFRTGHAPRARPFRLVFAVPAAAVVLGVPTDPGLTAAIAAWALLFWAAPAAAALARSVGPLVLPGAGLLAGMYLLAANHAAVDRSWVAGTQWALDSYHRARPGAVLLTQNPVHRALAADDVRPDVTTEYVAGLTAPAVRDAIARHPDGTVLMDASLFFEAERRAAILGDAWTTSPHGLAVTVRPSGEPPPAPVRNQWDGIDPDVESRPSPLRGGLTVRSYYARSILQSGYAHLQERQSHTAEREFLMALSLDRTNRTLAAMGLGRVFLGSDNVDAAIRTLVSFLRPDDEGAAAAMQLLGTAYARAAREEEGVRVLEEMLARMPRSRAAERSEVERSIARLRDRAAHKRGR